MRLFNFFILLLSLSSAFFAVCQQPQPSDSSATTLFPHSSESRIWISGQMNFIFQAHPDFHAPYSGANSLSPNYEKATSRVLTLFTGWQATQDTDLLLDVESAGGRGLSDALGLAGFTNLDVVRNPDLGAKPYIARVILHQIVPLGSERADSDRNFLSLSTRKPVRRFEFRLGKFSTADFFDLNSVGSDSHLQFANWTIDNNGGYDYAADTRGYTWGVIAEYDSRRWAARFGEMLMPKVANGIDLDWNIRRARAENMEVELRPRDGAILRALSYVNHANMGDYREAVRRFQDHVDELPTIENTRQQGRIKYGFGLNAEQSFAHGFAAFGRWGWNEGRHESFAYTEVNETLSFGGACSGELWSRRNDKVGAAFVTNGISKDHQEYLRLGGRGFLLGDGALNYSRENIVETYYTAHLWRGFFASADLQHITNPGYNKDRGPVIVPGLRIHLEL